MPMVNTASVLQHGILCYEEAAKINHQSVAMQPVQDLRDKKVVSRGRMLHQYANLYFHARNPMMYKRQNEIDQLCVLRISTLVLQLSGVVLADCNAASAWVRFLAPSQASLLDLDAIYAVDWTHPDRHEYFRRKSKKCAEVLVPERVDPQFLTGAYVVDNQARVQLATSGFSLPIQIEPAIFFK